MSNTQHTPGEWRVDPRNGESIIDENGVIIASTQYNPANDPRFNVPGSNRGPGRPRAERLANAAVVAAAPALLKALERLLWSYNAEHVIAARAAIAAARSQAIQKRR